MHCTGRDTSSEGMGAHAPFHRIAPHISRRSKVVVLFFSPFGCDGSTAILSHKSQQTTRAPSSSFELTMACRFPKEPK